MSNEPRRVLYFAENALSTMQGDGIVAAAILRGLPSDRLVGFFDHRNITPSPEYAERFHDLGPWRTPHLFRLLNRLSGGLTAEPIRRMFPDRAVARDWTFVNRQIRRNGFSPEVVYFAGQSYRYLRLAVMAAEHYDLPMVLLHMDDWMAIERAAAGRRWGARWHRLIVDQMTRAAARSLANTSSSPRLAERLSDMTGYRHVPVNHCCPDLMAGTTLPAKTPQNPIPVITYAGTMSRHRQGETLRVLASAVTELNAEGTRVHLHIYTPWAFAPVANAIAVPDAVYYKGQIGREEIAGIYRASDFLVTTVTYREKNIPRFRHSLSTKLSEYLCAGRPVISMGHADWHLHEYVQDHACGYSILMDEHFSLANIKEQLRRILSTDRRLLDAIGSRNRELWRREHDVNVKARATRRALRLDTCDATVTGNLDHAGLRAAADASPRRGVLWVGGPDMRSGESWVPLNKLKSIARRLVDVFDHTVVDMIGDRDASLLDHPDLDAILGYCHDIGLEPTLCLDAQIIDVARLSRLQEICPVVILLDVDPSDARARAMLQLATDALIVAGVRVSALPPAVSLISARDQLTVRTASSDAYVPYGWEPAGARWSLSDAQRLADVPLVRPEDLFEQIETLRAESADPDAFEAHKRIDTVRPDGPRPLVSPLQRVINQLSVRIPFQSSRRPVLWVYGSAEVGVEVVAALERHAWLSTAVEFGGFLSSPGRCQGDSLYGYPWHAIDDLSLDAADLIVITSERERLSIQEELSRHGWLDRMVPMFGLNAVAHRYERLLADAQAPAGTIYTRADATGWTDTDDSVRDEETTLDARHHATLELIERCPASEIGGGLLAPVLDRAWTARPQQANRKDVPLIGSTRAA